MYQHLKEIIYTDQHKFILLSNYFYHNQFSFLTYSQFIVSTKSILNTAYKKEKDSNVKERILLVKRVKIDKQEASSVAEYELNRSRWWAYKWLHRFDKDGVDGLKDQPRSGRPPDVPKDVMLKIRIKRLSCRFKSIGYRIFGSSPFKIRLECNCTG